ncbi:MAG: S9 family peptidase [Chloroflexi bacterium]|nr:S9 family peptidase [Chloroflexota bacterium]
MAKRRMRPDDHYLFRNVSDPQISPNGKLVAYVQSWSDRDADETRMAIYVAPADGRSPVRRITQGDHDHSPRWSPDGKYLAFVSSRSDKNQLFVAPLDGGDPRQLTTAKHGISQPAWSPDGRRIAYSARVGRHKSEADKTPIERAAPRVIRDLRYKLDGIGFFDERRLKIFVVDVQSGKQKQITKGDYFDDQPAWSPSGRSIAFVSDRQPKRHERQWRSDVWVVPATGGRPRKVTRSRGSAAQPTFSPNGRQIAFVGHENGDSGLAKNVQMTVVSAAGRGAPIPVSESIDRSVAGWPAFAFGRTFEWSRDGKSLLFLAADRGTQALYRADVKGKMVVKVLDGERQIEGFSLGPNGRLIAFGAVWLTQPPEIYTTTLNGRSREANVSHANDELKSAVALGRVERVKSRGRDGLEIESFALYPAGYKRGKAIPLALNVHGGPHGYHPSRGWSDFQSLAAAGYVVLLPNPRGSVSYGETFSERVVRDWGGEDYEDIMGAVDTMVGRGIADPDRLYIGGYSYGGFMGTWAVGHTDRFAAAVVGAPVSNQVSMFGTGDIPLFDIHEIGGTPLDDPDEYRLRSPVTYLEKVRTPVLLVHHEGDLRCPIGQSEEIFHALKVLGREVEFVRYPGGFHTYNTHTPSQVIDRIERTLAWYKSHASRRRSAKKPIAKAVARPSVASRR